MHWFWKSSAGEMDLEGIRRKIGARDPAAASSPSLRPGGADVAALPSKSASHRDSKIKTRNKTGKGKTSEEVVEGDRSAGVQSYRRLSDGSTRIPQEGEQRSRTGNERAAAAGTGGENNRPDYSGCDETQEAIDRLSDPNHLPGDRGMILQQEVEPHAGSSGNKSVTRPHRDQVTNRGERGTGEQESLRNKAFNGEAEETQLLIPFEGWTDGEITSINPSNGQVREAGSPSAAAALLPATTTRQPAPASIDTQPKRKVTPPDHRTRKGRDPKIVHRSKESKNEMELALLSTSHNENGNKEKQGTADADAPESGRRKREEDAVTEHGAYDLDTKAYAAKKNIAQGLVDVALMTSNATQLKYLLSVGPPLLRNPLSSSAAANTTSVTFSPPAASSLIPGNGSGGINHYSFPMLSEAPSSLRLLIASNRWPIYMYWITLYGILLSIFLQVILGISLLFNSRHDLSDRRGGKRAERHNNINLFLIFLILLINVFIDVLFMDYE